MQLKLFNTEPDTPAAAKGTWKVARLTHYCVIEPGDSPLWNLRSTPVHRPGKPAVWGIGNDEREAKEDALCWIKPFSDRQINSMDDLQDAITVGFMVLLKCSRRLVDEVGRYGGEIDFIIDGDEAYMPDEKIK